MEHNLNVFMHIILVHASVCKFDEIFCNWTFDKTFHIKASCKRIRMAAFQPQEALDLAALYYTAEPAVRHAVNMGALSVLFGEWTAFICDDIMMDVYTRRV